MNKSGTHEELAHTFDQLMNIYDLEKRIEILVDCFLGSIFRKGMRILEAGSGTGRISCEVTKYSRHLVTIDIGFHLTQQTKLRAHSLAAQADVLNLPFAGETFDVVISSEVIEHVPSPIHAIKDMWRVLKPDGWLILSTPNKLWQNPVRWASRLRLRPYRGYENFLSPGQLRQVIENNGGKIVVHKGFHLLPFQLRLFRMMNSKADIFGERLLPVMINQAMLAQK